jgi:hypothetical protein
MGGSYLGLPDKGIQQVLFAPREQDEMAAAPGTALQISQGACCMASH